MQSRILDFVAASRASLPSCHEAYAHPNVHCRHITFLLIILGARHALFTFKRPVVGCYAFSTRRAFLWVALLLVAGARLHIERGRKLGLALTGVANLGGAHVLTACLTVIPRLWTEKKSMAVVA
jgi:hypothetical protein